MTRLTHWMLHTAGELATSAFVGCTPETTIRELARRLADVDARHAVVHVHGQVRGVVSSAVLLRHLAADRDGKAADIMDAVSREIHETEPVYRLAGLLADGRVLPVVDDDRELRGILTRDRIVDSLLLPALKSLSSIGMDDPSQAARALKHAQCELVDALLADSTPATAIQRVLSAMNDDLYRLVLRSVTNGLDTDGWGSAPRPFAVIVMGSAGRRESLLAPDQDNGLVIEDYPDEEHPRIDGYFAELGRRLTIELDWAGIPLCPGHVMASQPLWRKTVTQWQAQIRGWMHHRSEQAMLNACVLLDMRPVAGTLALAEAVRGRMIHAVSAAPGFLRALTLNESTREVGLGWFHRLVPEGGDGPHAGELNIKRNGIMPIVEAARLFALSRGMMEASTTDRLQRLGADGVLAMDDVDYLCRTHALMCLLLLRQQVTDLRAGREAGRHLPGESLTRWERDQLVRGMKTTRTVLQQLRQHLVGSGV